MNAGKNLTKDVQDGIHELVEMLEYTADTLIEKPELFEKLAKCQFMGLKALIKAGFSREEAVKIVANSSFSKK